MKTVPPCGFEHCLGTAVEILPSSAARHRGRSVSSSIGKCPPRMSSLIVLPASCSTTRDDRVASTPARQRHRLDRQCVLISPTRLVGQPVRQILSVAVPRTNRGPESEARDRAGGLHGPGGITSPCSLLRANAIRSIATCCDLANCLIENHDRTDRASCPIYLITHTD